MHRPGLVDHCRRHNRDPLAHLVEGHVFLQARHVSRQGFEGHHLPAFSGRSRQQQGHVTDVGAYVVNAHAGPEQVVDGLLQLDLVSAQPVIFFGEQIQFESETRQAAGGNFYLRKFAWSGAVERAAHQPGQRFDAINTLLEGNRQDA